MPAIQPARLKKQAADLSSKFDQPAVFVRELHHLLDIYTDHTHRKGQAGEPSPLISSYKAPAPVMRQVWLELTPKITQHPAALLPLCDALWLERNYDLRMLAARLLGLVPSGYADSVINRLQSWVQQGMERRIMDGLFQAALMRLQADTPDRLLEMVSSWLSRADASTQQAGLSALRVLIEQSDPEHFPTFYRLLIPFLRVAPSRLRPDILGVLIASINCSPSETAYVLRQSLSTADSPDTPWIIRQVLNEFPEEIRGSLRQAMKEN